MKISDAIDALKALQAMFGDIGVECDCPHCGLSFRPTKIASGPPIAKLQGKLA